ncbi:hypothetical protein LZG74_17740 [Dyadobacter sp. CY327]|uniref:nSTAND3 domain-containing NTPase n=1 Tax=Dyadobacter sp. CY327 TaxID=2907301 RepID=UPI001F473F41|nr:hypothetical protein [Dyadobacter sp. CY327]MCE7072164.1 hypothetical protein [Dyadobacter sp. CY327]
MTNHFKLWFSGAAVLQKLLHYHIVGRSQEFIEEDLKRKLRLYVETPSLEKARQQLADHNFVVITGEPGTGKTTTAELLLYDLIKDDYNLVYIYDDIKEIEAVIRENKKQVFYFDDFLGHNIEEINKSRGAESALEHVVKTITRNENKKLILTTRTFILNSALEASERLRRSRLKDGESVVELADYTFEQKDRLLSNHIEESEISDELKAVLNEENVKDFIIKHDNFTPRSVEFITTIDRVESFAPEEYRNFVKDNFNFPDEIWRHSYEQQISNFDRIFLNTMLSFGDSVDIQILERAFNSRLRLEQQLGTAVPATNVFVQSFRHLNEGFIVREFQDDENFFKFINPSLVDFLLKYIEGNVPEFEKILLSSVHLSQITSRFLPVGWVRENVQETTSIIRDRLIKQSEFYIYENTKQLDLLVYAMLLAMYYNDDEAINNASDALRKVEDWSHLDDDEKILNDFRFFLIIVDKEEVVNSLKSSVEKIAEQLLANQFEIDETIGEIKLLISKYDLPVPLPFNEEIIDLISDLNESLLNDKIENYIEECLTYTSPMSFIEEFEVEADAIQSYLNDVGLNINANFSQLGDHDWQSIGAENYFREQMEKDD